MKWKQWKAGLFIAFLTGTLQAIVAIGIQVTWRQVLVLLAFNVGTTCLAYLKAHPEDSINFDTTVTTRTQVVQSTIKTPSATVVDGTPSKDNNEKANP